MRISTLAVALVALVSMASATASEHPSSHEEALHYTYAEAGASKIHHEDEESSVGVAVKASWAVSDSWHFFAGAERHDWSSADSLTLRAGIGFNQKIKPKTDMVFRASYESFNVSSHATHHEEHSSGLHGIESRRGLVLEAGLRTALSERLEGSIGLRHLPSESETLVTVGTELRAGTHWAVAADAEFGSSGKGFFFGVRRYF